MLAGRVGGALTAELGTMNVTEQIDAVRSMGTDPMRYLVAPRVLACLLLTPFLIIYADLLGVLGGYFVSAKAVWHQQPRVLGIQFADGGAVGYRRSAL